MDAVTVRMKPGADVIDGTNKGGTARFYSLVPSYTERVRGRDFISLKKGRKQAMKVTLKDGSCKEYPQAMPIIDIAKDISEGLARVACVAELDGEVVDLRTVADGEHELNILTFDSDAGKAAYRHTASHVLAQAVKRLYPEAKCAIGPSIEDGFYYDFDMEPLDREALDKIEKEMKKVVKEGASLERFTLPREEAVKLMKERQEPYKVELIEDLPEDAEISFYQQGDFIDLCAGPHLMSTKPLKAIKLISSSGAYWRGNENADTYIWYCLYEEGGPGCLSCALGGHQETRPQ